MRTSILDLSRERDNGSAAKPTPNGRRWEDPICAAVAQRLGIRADTARHRLAELPVEMEAFLDAFNAQGATARKERFMKRIRAADRQETAPPLVPATFQLAQEADSREDMAETAYLSDHSDAHLARLIAASEEERRWQDARLLALYAERDRRRRMPT